MPNPRNNKKITLKEVSEQSGFSVSAVSKVLLGGGGLTTRTSESTVEKIKKVAQELGYKPNQIARQLKKGQSRLIGAIIHSHAPMVYFKRFSQIQQKLAKLGYGFLLGQSDGSIDLIEKYLDEFQSRNTEVILSAFFEYPNEMNRLEKIYSKIDNVLYFGKPPFNHVAYIETDVRKGVLQIVDHLVTFGIKRIAIDITSKFYRSIQMRLAGYTDGLLKYSIPMDHSLIIETHDSSNFATELVEKALNQKAEAIIAGNDLRALEVIRELQKRGLNVPNHLRVTGFDNMEFSSHLNPSLTTVDFDHQIISEEVGSMIQSYVDHKQFSENRSIAPNLILRESA